jgi:hypothetical protein
MVDLATLHAQSLLVGQPVAAVFDLQRGDGGRTLIALHDLGTLGATVFDGEAPDDTTSRFYGALALEALP